MSDNGVYQRLAERFPAAAHKTRKQGGRDLTYVTGEMVISRLNEALGWQNWSFRVVREGATDVEAWVLGELTVTIDGQTITRQHYGNQDLSRGQHATTDLYKSAATDAIKKAATTIGIGLYLYDEDERREVEADMREAKRAPQKPTAPSKDVAAAAAVTGAPTPINNERAELVKALENGIAYARSIGLDPALPAVADMSNADLQETVDALRTQCRLVLAERKKQGA
jgi:hypothetical protein